MPQNQNVILPTIGRKIWFFPVMDPSHPNHQAYFSRFDDQPLDATVIYVYQQQPDQKYQLLNLSVIDHAGLVTGQQRVPLVQPGDDIPTDEAYVTWMPYQVAQSTVGAASAKPNPDTPPLPPAVDPVAPSAPTPPTGITGTAPKVTESDLNDNIANVEIVKHVSSSGQILRWAVLTTRNGFSVTGRPSAAVSPENDNQSEGEKIAFENAKNELWPLMGYALKEKLSAK